jgi:hypothetical protein
VCIQTQQCEVIATNNAKRTLRGDESVRVLVRPRVRQKQRHCIRVLRQLAVADCAARRTPAHMSSCARPHRRTTHPVVDSEHSDNAQHLMRARVLVRRDQCARVSRLKRQPTHAHAECGQIAVGRLWRVHVTFLLHHQCHHISYAHTLTRNTHPQCTKRQQVLQRVPHRIERRRVDKVKRDDVGDAESFELPRRASATNTSHNTRSTRTHLQHHRRQVGAQQLGHCHGWQRVERGLCEQPVCVHITPRHTLLSMHTIALLDTPHAHLKHLPGASRPALPARCAHAARDAGTTASSDMRSRAYPRIYRRCDKSNIVAR